MRRVDPARPYFAPEDIERALSDIREILESGRLILGPYTRRFEEEFARYVGARCAVAVNSGTSALEATLRALGVGPGDEVIVPVNTFIATSNAVIFAGARPVFVDVEFETINQMVSELRKIFGEIRVRRTARSGDYRGT